MGKVEENKQLKKRALYEAAFALFTEKGFSKTSIAEIAARAGLAKGTFYLYFKDKYDLRDQLIAVEARKLFTEAQEKLHLQPVSGFVNQILAIVDLVLEQLEAKPQILQFIAKNLSWGIFRSALQNTESELHMYQYYLDMMREGNVNCSQPELMMYTLTELVSSTCYSCILYRQPVPLEEYRPWMFRSIRSIIQTFTSED